MGQGYTVGEERANYLSHGIGALLAIVAGIFLHVSYAHSGDALMRLSMALYIGGMLSSYVASTSYHACPECSRYRPVLRKFDHAAIYWFIAGSYSPLMLVAMRDRGYWGWGIFIAVWLCALVGTVHTFRTIKKKSIVKTVCYVAMGLMILIAFKPFMDSVSAPVVWWVIGEGICYITGAIFYSVYKVKYLHFVFHMFVIAGSFCHFMAVWKMLQMFYG